MKRNASDAQDSGMDERLSVFYDLAMEEIPPNERSRLYQEVQEIEQRYCDHTEIAAGGLKKISRVYDRKTGRHVAFASLRDTSRKELYDPFLREARLTGNLHHPNIIPIHDLGLNPEGEPFFTMELKKGRSLAQLIKERSKGKQIGSLDDLLSIFLKICDGMAYAHSKNTLHLDLKPENIQIGEFGEVLICDWGLAKIISTPEDVRTDYMEAAANPDLVNPITLNGQVRGTPGYMAPEQVTSGGKKTYTTDIYGLGAILYAILTGQAPVSGSLKECLDKTRNGQITPPSDIDSSIPRSLNAVVMKALRKDPEKRYQTIETLVSEIHKFTQGYATNAENASLLKMTGLLIKRHRTFFITAAVVLLGYAVLSAVYMVHITRSRSMALAERNRAKEALDQYLQEQRVSSALRENIEQTALDAARIFWKRPMRKPSDTRAIFNDAMVELDRALEQNPDNAQAWSNKGYLCFLEQRFAEAEQCFLKGGDEYLRLRKLSAEYATVKPDDALLDSTQFAPFATKVMEARGNSADSTLELLLLYDYAAKRISPEHAEKVRTVLQLVNPAWKDSVFSYSMPDKTLQIGGPGLKRLRATGRWTSNESFIRTLRVKHLIFTDTDFSDMKELRNLGISSLDISRTAIGNLNEPQLLPNLIELTARADQLQRRELREIGNRGIKIIYQ